MRVAGSRPQGPVGQVSRGLGAQAARSQITIFRKPPGGSLAKAWVSAETAASEVGTWRETKPGYPPYPPPPHPPAFWGGKGGFSSSPPSATIQHAPQGRRIATQLRYPSNPCKMSWRPSCQNDMQRVRTNKSRIQPLAHKHMDATSASCWRLRNMSWRRSAESCRLEFSYALNTLYSNFYYLFQYPYNITPIYMLLCPAVSLGEHVKSRWCTFCRCGVQEKDKQIASVSECCKPGKEHANKGSYSSSFHFIFHDPYITPKKSYRNLYNPNTSL